MFYKSLWVLEQQILEEQFSHPYIFLSHDMSLYSLFIIMNIDNQSVFDHLLIDVCFHHTQAHTSVELWNTQYSKYVMSFIGLSFNENQSVVFCFRCN